MKKLYLCLAVLAAGFFFFSCDKNAAGPDSNDVSAITGGVILRTDPVEVVFTREHDTSEPLPSSLFRFKPAAKGSLSWKDAYTLVFTPSEPFKAGERYSVTVDGEKIGVSAFRFQFETAFPLLEVSVDPVRINENGEVLVEGTVQVEDGTPAAKIEELVLSSELGKPDWTHEQGRHRFHFKPVERTGVTRTVEITWSGRPIGSKESGFTTVHIPGSSAFEMVDLRQNGGILEVSFSAPLKPYTDLRGFVSLSGSTDVRFSLEGNVVKIFGSSGGGDGISPGTELLIQDIEDIDGNVLAQPVQYTVPETWELPELRFVGSGTVLPTSQGAALALETRNVSGVLVEAFQIPANNMIQFLQVNAINGERELDRVGEPLWTKSFDFPWKGQDQNRWIRRGLDLSELSRKYPDSMFRIRVSFRRRHIQYECQAGHGDFSRLTFPDDTLPPYSANNNNNEQSYWDYYQSEDDYTWYRMRRDPCHPAFYTPRGDHNITIGRNVLVSDLGLLAKRSLNGTWLVAASNLKNAQPVSGADINVFNYQGRLLFQTRTGSDGTIALPDMASAASPGVPAFISAQAGAGRAYLKINDSLALVSSHFDLSGDKPISGIRGLIYGERGVWRPGDDIYLSFLMSDPAGTLPANHPVSFELEDPRGRIALQRTYTASVDGFYPMTASTPQDAPTGDWVARVQVGGNVFSKGLKIETVMPNRLKMNLDFAGGAFLESGKMPVNLEAAWLYGASALGLRADVSVVLGDKETSFPSYGDYSFRDPSRRVSGERQTLWEGNLDNAGKALFNMELNGGSSVPGKLSARFLTRVFEPSGVFSSEQVAMEFSPYRRYVGLKLPRGDASRNMLLTDTDHAAEIVVLDGSGKPASGDINLDCAVYKLSWRWWWEKGAAESAEFASALSRNPVMRGSVKASGGKASWNFQVKYPDWGRYLIMVRDSAGGHAAASIVYIDWPGWAGRAQEGGQGAQAMLVLNAAKPVYGPGEKISVSFPSNKDAQALAVVEKGGQVIKSQWLGCSDSQTVFEFSADPSMAPNVYVHVTLLQPHLQTQNDLPIRLYGIIPVMVEDPMTRLRPQIEAPSSWLPESKVSFTVSEAAGRPMTYTVAVVDEGLLGITRFSLPNPWNVFYAKEASFLKSWDLYQDIMGAFSGQLETLLAIGGGDDMFDDTAKNSQRFKPVVRYFGPYQLAAGEKKQELFDLPPYIGALRIMVLAASSQASSPRSGGNSPSASQRAYGTAEKSVQVSSDLMVFGTIPRLLSPGDEAEIPVTVNSYKEGARTVKVSLAVPGAVVAGASSQNIAFDKPGEKTIRFTVKAPAIPGWIKFNINAESPGLRAAGHITDLEVRSTAVPVTRTSQHLVQAGETWQGSIEFPGLPATNTGRVELSRFPPLNLEKRLDYLVRYPHGCVEQTTSAAFPQLYLDKILSLEGNRAAEIRTNVNAGIERLSGFQTANGGFSYWPGGGDDNDWGSTYAGHFLVEARRAGYAVNGEVMKKWLHFQKDRAARWQTRNGNPTVQAYRLYTIALAGEADLGSMNRLREQRDIEPQARWRLAAAYWYAGQRDAARGMVRDLVIPDNKYRELSGTFGSALRDKAMILETLILLEDPGRTRPLFEELSQALSTDDWLSTQETAYALIAMAPYMGASKAQGPISLEFSMAGQNRTISFESPVIQEELGSLAGTSGTFSFTNRSSAPVYARISVKGLPAEGGEPALSEGLSLRVEYRDDRGRSIDPKDLKPGEDMEIRATVRNSYSQTVSEIALVHPVPASWEIINTRLAGDSSSSSFKYQDFRDDRVMTYFDLSRGQEKTVIFRVNKTYGGTYFRPAIRAYAMYDESIQALVPGVK